MGCYRNLHTKVPSWEGGASHSLSRDYLRLIKWKVLATPNPFEVPVTSLLVFGSQLLALSEDGGRLLIWDTNDGCEHHLFLVYVCLSPRAISAFQSSIQFEPGFSAVSVLHPATYLNKVLVASSQGSMQLWNIRTQFVLSFAPVPQFRQTF